MHFKVLKNIKYRHSVSLNIKKKWFLNILLNNHYFFYDIYRYNLLKMDRSSITKLRILCILSGRSRSTFSKVRLSRMFFKKYGQSGFINGLIKGGKKN